MNKPTHITRRLVRHALAAISLACVVAGAALLLTAPAPTYDQPPPPPPAPTAPATTRQA